MSRARILTGDCLDLMPTLDANSVDAIVTDPPYGLEFMGKDWDRFRSDDRDVPGYNNRTSGAIGEADGTATSNHAARRNRAVAYGAGKRATTSRCEACGRRDQFRNPHGCPDGTNWRTEIIDPYAAPPSMLAFQNWVREWALLALRVAKPGAHLVAFGGTRTYHRLVCGIEEAGWEIRDCLSWLYGSGFPKSLDVSKAIDKAAGAEREVLGPNVSRHGGGNGVLHGGGIGAGVGNITAPATDAARQWQGWGTALKPGHEPVILAQKPYTPQQLLATLVPITRELICGVASSEKTGTPSSEPLRACGFLNTAPWLLQCLDVLSTVASKCTTETASVLTTDLRILKSSLSRLTLGTTTEALTPTGGVESNAMLAAAISASVQAKCERLAFTSAGDVAIDWRADEGSGPGGSDLAPAWEPIILARKPLSGTVAVNVQAHGTGALNIDGCRIAGKKPDTTRGAGGQHGITSPRGAQGRILDDGAGRWPANVVLDEDAARLLDETVGERTSGFMRAGTQREGSGGPSRFFYTAKASRAERERMEGGPTEAKPLNWSSGEQSPGTFQSTNTNRSARNHHPTVKPLDLMRWLVRLVTPPGGLVLDPFAGSGTTGVAAMAEGFRFLGVEREPEYVAIAEARLNATQPGLAVAP